MLGSFLLGQGSDECQHCKAVAVALCSLLGKPLYLPTCRFTENATGVAGCVLRCVLVLKCTSHPLIPCLCCVQDPDDLDKPLWMEEGERPARLPPPASVQGHFFAGEGRRRVRILSVCMSCVRKWFFISATADLVRVTHKVEAYILFQFAVLCFNNGHYYHYNFGIALPSVSLFYLFSLCKLDELQTCSQSHIGM